MLQKVKMNRRSAVDANAHARHSALAYSGWYACLVVIVIDGFCHIYVNVMQSNAYNLNANNREINASQAARQLSACVYPTDAYMHIHIYIKIYMCLCAYKYVGINISIFVTFTPVCGKVGK